MTLSTGMRFWATRDGDPDWLLWTVLEPSMDKPGWLCRSGNTTVHSDALSRERVHVMPETDPMGTAKYLEAAHRRFTGPLPESADQSLEVRSVALQGALWTTIADLKEDNLAVIIDALAALTKRASGYNMAAEVET